MTPRLAAWLSAAPAAALAGAFVYYTLTAHNRRIDADAAAKGGRRLLGPLFRGYWYWLHGPAVKFVLRRGYTPDALTLTGGAVTLVAGAAFAAGAFGLAGWLVVVGGAFDILDGKVARARGHASAAGAFLDSTLDRYGDWALFAGLAVHYRASPAGAAALLALGGGFVVSYARARAESLGVTLTDGWLQRGERFFVLAAGGILTPLFAAAGVPYDLPLAAALTGLAVLANATAASRLVTAYRRLAERPAAAP